MAATLAIHGSLVMLAPGCMSAATPPALATGEKPTTGVPRFDRLFNEVHASLLAVQEARSEEIDVRGALARRLGLPETALVDALGVRLRERTERLARDGLTLELEFTGIDDVDGLEQHGDALDDDGSMGDGTSEAGADAEGDAGSPTATLRTPGREPQRRELRLLEALAQAALSGATIYANMGRERHKTERLLAEVGQLEARVDSSFADPGERDRVRRKLVEAKDFLPQLNAQARDVSGAADILISLLDEAANTAPVAARRRPPTPPKEGTPRPPASPAGAPPKAPTPQAAFGFPTAPGTPPAAPAASPAPSTADSKPSATP